MKYEFWACQKHLISHKKESTVTSSEFRCDRGDCGKTFSNQFGLTNHLSLHDNNLNKCFFCPWGCSAVAHHAIDEHLNHHFRTPKFDCAFCDKKFYRKFVLNQHMELYHEKIEGKYSCSYCEYRTHSKANLGMHIGRLHTGTVKSKPKSK